MKGSLLGLSALLLAAPLAGQATADARATIRIDEILSVQVRPGGGEVVRSADGVYRELSGAVSVEVFANRPWQLFVVADATAALAGGAGEDGLGLWWRLAGQPSATAETYREAERWRVPVASGSAGRSTVDLDYRWLDAPGRELEPGIVLRYTLAPR